MFIITNVHFSQYTCKFWGTSTQIQQQAQHNQQYLRLFINNFQCEIDNKQYTYSNYQDVNGVYVCTKTKVSISNIIMKTFIKLKN